MAQMSVEYSRDEINQKIPYAIIVEGREKKNYGRVKREYLKEFNIKERQTIGVYYNIFYKWYLVKGVPDSYHFTIKNLQLLDRAGNFFGNI